MKFKVLKILLVTSLLFLLSTPVFASEYGNEKLDSIANKTIIVESEIDQAGNIITKYSNLNMFAHTATTTFPSLSQLDLAKYILNYTQQDFTGLSDDEILEILQYNSLSTVKHVLQVNEDGTTTTLNSNIQPYWTTTDGYLEFNTAYAKTGTNNDGSNCWDVWTRATWLKYPLTRSNEALSLGHNAVYDDSVNARAIVSQTFKCLNCGKNTYKNRSTTSSNGDLNIVHHNLAPEAHFVAANRTCDNCTTPVGLSDTHFSAYLKYGLITYGSAHIVPGYGHTTAGIGSVSVSFDTSGRPSFSGSGTSIVQNYVAPATTVN